MSEHPSKFEWQRFREGMDILAFYVPRDKQYIAAAEDYVFVADVADQISEIHAHDRLQLELLGFHVDPVGRFWRYECETGIS